MFTEKKSLAITVTTQAIYSVWIVGKVCSTHIGLSQKCSCENIQLEIWTEGESAPDWPSSSPSFFYRCSSNQLYAAFSFLQKYPKLMLHHCTVSILVDLWRKNGKCCRWGGALIFCPPPLKYPPPLKLSAHLKVTDISHLLLSQRVWKTSQTNLLMPNTKGGDYQLKVKCSLITTTPKGCHPCRNSCLQVLPRSPKLFPFLIWCLLAHPWDGLAVVVETPAQLVASQDLWGQNSLGWFLFLPLVSFLYSSFAGPVFPFWQSSFSSFEHCPPLRVLFHPTTLW